MIFMVRRCINCDRELRTGIKYCYICRSQRNARKHYIKEPRVKDNYGAWVFLIIIGIIVLFVVVFLIGNAIDKGRALSEFSDEQRVLIDECRNTLKQKGLSYKRLIYAENKSQGLELVSGISLFAQNTAMLKCRLGEDGRLNPLYPVIIFTRDSDKSASFKTPYVCDSNQNLMRCPTYDSKDKF